MQKITRSEFLKIGALGVAASFAPSSLWSLSKSETNDENLLQRLIKSNDASVDRFLEFGERRFGFQYYRPFSEAFAVFTASYCQPDSKHYKSEILATKMQDIISKLLGVQYPDGTLDAGGNRQSPPDTAFMVENLCPAAIILDQQNFPELNSVKEGLKKFFLNAGEGLTTGGVHTPNHRWVVSSALARLYSIFKDEKYVKRIDEWLAEGIDINEDGQYSERSRNYSVVVNNSLLNIGRILNRPELYEPVKKNLLSTYYYMETNGDLITLDSRRQDQNYPLSMSMYYLFYRYLAIYNNDETFGAITKEIESFDDFEKRVLSQSLIYFMENPILLTEIKTNKEPEKDFSKLIPLSGLARIRRGNITASIFGGNDKPVIISSGRSTNPTFFTFRKGSAFLEYVRLSTSFFNTGYFRSDGVEKDGNKFYLIEKKEAYYYLPLPEDKRNANGDYKLSQSLDGRFWSKMDFDSRPHSTMAIETKINIEEENGSFKINFDVDGANDVEVILELCFKADGKLEGVTPGFEKDDYFLKKGFAKYSFGNDIIEIGPGKAEHNNVRQLDGEEYSTHFGSIKGKGMHVYLTGYVPFKHSITIK
jgi:hypothetical protein